MEMRKLLVLSMVLVCAVSLAVHAGGAKETGAKPGAAEYAADPNLNAPGVTPIAKKAVTLKIGVAQNANVVDFEKNDMTLLLEKQGNFNLDFVYYASAEMKTQINLVVASGKFDDLPDVIMSDPADAMVMQWGQAGAIIPLNQYYKNSAHHLNIAKQRTGVDFVPMVTSPDGNIYGIPQFNQSLGNEYASKIWVYKPWLDVLGLKDPVTTEDMTNLLTAIKTKDPNKNGKADEIPLLGENLAYVPRSLWMQSLVNPFQFMNDTNYNVKDGTIGVFFNTNGYRQALKWIRSLVSKGLLPDYQFTLDSNTYKNLMSNKEIPLVGVAPNSSATASYRIPDYVGVAPLTHPGIPQNTAFTPSSAAVRYMVSAACKNPEAAFRLGDLLVSEDMSIMTRWGNQGKHWDYVKNAKIDLSKYAAWYEKSGFPGYVIIYEDPWGIVQNFHWYQAGPFVRQYGIAAGRLTPVGQVNSEYMIAQIMPTYQAVGKASKAWAVSKLIYTKEETQTVTEPLASLESYVAESTAAFAVGQRDINNDAEWAAYLKQLDAIGLPKVLAVVQKIYNRMYGTK